jgi:type I restriction enzyme M protein
MTRVDVIRQFLAEFLDKTKGAMSSSDAAEIALLMLAWLKSSKGNQLPVDLRIGPVLMQAPGEGFNILVKLLNSQISGYRDLRIASTVGHLDARSLLPVFDLALRLQDTGIITELNAQDVISALSSVMPPESFFLPGQVAELIVKLSGIHPTDSIYVGWDMGPIALLAASISDHVYLETPTYSDFPTLLCMLSRKQFEIHESDPVMTPSAVEVGKLNKFEIALAMPPINLRYPAEIAVKDWFRRFPEQTSSGAILSTRHVLSHCTRRAVIGLANSITFSSGVERVFREDLLRQGLIEAVINMPSGLLLNTSIPFSILVLDPRGGHDQVKFVDANTDQFREPTSKTKNCLSNVDQLAELTFSNQQNSGSGFVKTSEIIRNESSLVGNRYIVPEEIKRVFRIGASERQEPLENLVERVRPMPTVKQGSKGEAASRQQSGIVEVGEISASDLPPFGYISGPGRTVLIDQLVVAKNDRLFLRPLDILLIIKGSVGKTGLVPRNVPDPGPGGWVAGQSAIVLRVKPGAIDPRALIVQLRSTRGKALLQHLVSGSTIPLIQLGQLMKLPILIGNTAEIGKASEAFERETALQKEIDCLRNEQAAVASLLWGP